MRPPEGPANGNGHDVSTGAEGEVGPETVNGGRRGRGRSRRPLGRRRHRRDERRPDRRWRAQGDRADRRSRQRPREPAPDGFRGRRRPAGDPRVPPPRPLTVRHGKRPVRNVSGRGASFSAFIMESAHERHPDHPRPHSRQRNQARYEDVRRDARGYLHRDLAKQPPGRRHPGPRRRRRPGRYRPPDRHRDRRRRRHRRSRRPVVVRRERLAARTSCAARTRPAWAC